MPADASIYSLIRQPAALPGPMDTYAQGMQLRHLIDQGELAQLQRRKIEQEFADENATRQFYASLQPGENARGKINDLLRVNPKAGMAAQKFYQDQDKADADLAKTRVDVTAKNTQLLGGALVSAMADPSDQNLSGIFGALRAAGMNVEQTELLFAQVPDLGKRKQLIQSFAFQTPEGLAAIKAVQPNIKMVDSGQQIIPYNENALAGPVGQMQGGQVVQRMQTPESIASNAVTMRGQNMTDARARETLEAGRWTNDLDRGLQINTQTGETRPIMSGGKPLGPKAREDTDNLRKEWNALPEVKNYREVVPIINAAKTAPDTTAGDFALIYGVGKILDPTSVVREGEMNMVIKSGSPAERVKSYLTYLHGNGRITPQMRNELNQMLSGRVGEMKASYDAAKESYAGIVKRRGYAPEDVFAGVPDVKETPGAGKAAPATAETRVKNLPDPAKHNGYTATDPTSGITYKSDGTKWVKVNG